MAASSTDPGEDFSPDGIAIDGVPVAPDVGDILAIDLKEMDLSVRTRNVLQNAEIKYLGDLVKWDEQSLSRLQNCGRKTVDELRDLTRAYGLTLGKQITGWTQPEEKAEAIIVPTIPSVSDLDETTGMRLHIRIKELNLSVRVINALTNVGVEFVGDLIQKSPLQLMHLQNCGRKTVVEIEILLKKLDLHLGMALAGWDQVTARENREAWDSDKNSQIGRHRRELADAPKGSSLEEELEGILKSVANDKSEVAARNIEISIKFLGWNGQGQRTLESVAQDYAMTRERVRQISSREIAKIQKNIYETPWLDKAIEALQRVCPATPQTLAATLLSEGIAKTNFDPTGVESACRSVGKDFGLEVSHVGRVRFYVKSGSVETARAFFRLCRRLSSSRGCVNFEAACDELKIDEAERANFRSIAVIGNYCEWLDEEQRWLFVPTLTRNRLTNLISKILSVGPTLRVSDLRRALSRSRRLPVVPPAAVIVSFVKRVGLAKVDGDLIQAPAAFPNALEPGGNEEIFVAILKEHGPALAWDRFRGLCVAAGMNPITFGIYLSASPIIARLTRGIYSLIGADIPPGTVEDVANEMEASRKPFEWGWTARGTLWCALRPLGRALSFGALTIPSFVSDIAGGEWSPRLGGQNLDGSIKCNGTFLHGLRRPLVNAGAESEDVCILEFDLAARTVNLTIGSDELIDLWDSGDIELDVPDSLEAEETDDGGP